MVLRLCFTASCFPSYRVRSTVDPEPFASPAGSGRLLVVICCRAKAILLFLFVMETYELLELENEARRNCNNCQNMDRLRLIAATRSQVPPFAVLIARSLSGLAGKQQRAAMAVSIRDYPGPANTNCTTRSSSSGLIACAVRLCLFC
jgi:hypothetical protein